MDKHQENVQARRRFLGFLAASPLMISGGLIHGPFAKMLALHPADDKGAQGALEGIAAGENLITSPDQAFDVMDFELVARKVLPPAHFGYLATGVDDDATVRANREGFSHLEIRSRRMIDVSKIDLSVRLLGTAWTSPIVLAPVSSQKAFHPDGEIASAKAARAKNHLYILSTVARFGGRCYGSPRCAHLAAALYDGRLGCDSRNRETRGSRRVSRARADHGLAAQQQSRNLVARQESRHTRLHGLS